MNPINARGWMIMDGRNYASYNGSLADYASPAAVRVEMHI